MRTLLALSLLPAVAGAAPPDVLLMGNSYVQGGQLDLVLADVLPLVHPDGGASVVERRAAGGLRLVDHLSRVEGEDPAWQEALAPGVDHWELVVLQEQSQIPGFPAANPEVSASRDAAEALDGHLAAHAAETVFLATWGRRDGDVHNPDRYPDFHTMNALLLEGYLAYAARTTDESRRSTVVPVGSAFAAVWAADEAAGRSPTVEGSDFHALYTGDGSHPSSWGTYLTALTISVSVSGWPASGRPAPADVLEGERGDVVQAAADAAVLDDPFAVPQRFAWAWSDVAGAAEVEIRHDWMRPQVLLAEDAGTVDRVVLGDGGDDAALWIREGGALEAGTLALGGGQLLVDGGVLRSEAVEGGGAVAVRAGEWEPGAGALAALDVGDAGTLVLRSDAAGAELVATGPVVLAGDVVVSAISGGEEDALLEAGSLDASAARFMLPEGAAVGTKDLPDGRVVLVAAMGELGDDAEPVGDDAASAAGEDGGCGCAGVAGGGALAPALLGLLAVARRRP